MGYLIVLIIGLVIAFIGSMLSSSRIWEFMDGSKRDGLTEEYLYTRRLGTCIGGEGLLICLLTELCIKLDTPIPLFIGLPISVIGTVVLLYFIHKKKPI